MAFPRLAPLLALLVLCCAAAAPALARSIFLDESVDGVAVSSDAITVCPDITVEDPAAPQPPAGYTFLTQPVIGPAYKNATWYLIDALHSNSATWVPQHAVCKYAACASYGCPTIALLSDATFVYPTKPDAEWGVYSRINDTLICAPLDHDVNKCPFSN